ncbi:MAG TPA: hypothetical protein DGT21_25050 [Armatimonadetes bacterium]|nr:hypothetical protein [Armatimonadota bacterium]
MQAAAAATTRAGLTPRSRMSTSSASPANNTSPGSMRTQGPSTVYWAKFPANTCPASSSHSGTANTIHTHSMRRQSITSTSMTRPSGVRIASHVPAITLVQKEFTK